MPRIASPALRSALETKQIAIYVSAIGLGALVGTFSPELRPLLEGSITPVIAALLYATFLQVPFSKLREAVTHVRFLGALLTTNFLAVPLVVWSLTAFVPLEPAIQVGVLLVLLTPCIDYVVVFTHLGRGDAPLLLSATPALLLLQMLLLPVYLWLFLGQEASSLMRAAPFLSAFLWLIVLPLVLVWLTEFWSERSGTGRRYAGAMEWLPVPLMALTLFLVVGAEAHRVLDHVGEIAWVVPVYLAYLVLLPFVGKAASKLFKLDHRSARAVVFSGSTRNSLVVLPLALAVPFGHGLAPAVVVTQTLVELLGELVYIRLVPRLVPPSSDEGHVN